MRAKRARKPPATAVEIPVEGIKLLMKKFLIILLAVVIIGFGIYYIFSGSDSIKNYPPHEGPIVAFGDSLVAGVGSTDRNDFVSILSGKIGEPIINLGVSGDTTRDGLARVGEAIDKHPRIVILLLGGNDYLKRIPREETFQNLRTLISRFHEDGAIVVLLGVRGGILIDHFDTDFENLAEETGATYVPNVLDGLFRNKSLMTDEIHPNNNGYKFIAEKIYPVLAKVLR